MPLMMDGHMDGQMDNQMDNQMGMEDLFGDGNGLSPPRRPSKELHQRVDDLRGGGCCQGIAWSKWGSIASIASDGITLELRNLRCHPEDGTWSLSDPSPTPTLSMSLDGGPLRHLAWSPTGSDLAVFDSFGRISILNIFSSLNQPTLSRIGDKADTADDLNRVVGCHWLNMAPFPQGRPVVLHGPAIKEGLGGYRYEALQVPFLGPSHPNYSKSALVCVTTNGLLRVLWQQPNSSWHESHTELESIVTSDELITHAAICSDKTGTLLIAFATTSKQLRTVRAMIDWTQPKSTEKVNQAMTPLNPTIKTRHLVVTSWNYDISGESPTGAPSAQSMAQLSHLEFLPSDAAPGRMTAPTIVTIRSYLPPMSDYNQDVYTTVDRWEFHERSQTIHPAFEQLSSRRNSVGSQPGAVFFLKRLNGFTVNKVAISMHLMNFAKVLFFAYSDSTVEYRERHSMVETLCDGDLEKVWHLAQIGFTYPEDEPCLQTLLSPSYCSIIQIDNNGKVKWKQLDYHLGDIGSSMKDAQYSGVIAALALSCSTAVMGFVNHDDILATMHKYAKGSFNFDWGIETAKVVKANVDSSGETHYDTLIRNTSIQLLEGMQQSLGFRGEFNPRTFSGKLCWIGLQLRNIVVLISMASNMKLKGPNGENTSPLDDPEIIRSLAGSIKWGLELMAWITDSLVTLQKDIPTLTDPTAISLPDLFTHLFSTNNIALHCLLSSPTRGFLHAFCRRLVHIDYIARKAMQQSSQSANPQNPNDAPPAISHALRAAYQQIADITTNPIVKTNTFEILLSSLTSKVNTAYSSHIPPLSGTLAERPRNLIELRMMLGGSIPDAFKSVIADLFRKEGLLDSVCAEIDSATLFFANFEALEVDEDPVSIAQRKRAGRTMDCFRKAWLINPKKSDEQGSQPNPAVGGPLGMAPQGKPPPKWRRCARCASVMEDNLSQRQALQWLVMQQRRCFCSGFWDSLAAGKTVA